MSDCDAAHLAEVAMKKKTRKITISELEKLLNQECEVPITIMPNGEVRALTKKEQKEKPQKILTMRENLCGEYA